MAKQFEETTAQIKLRGVWRLDRGKRHAGCSKLALLKQARLNRRDPHLGFTQRLGACMHGVGAQDKVAVMWDRRAYYELRIELGLEFDRGGHRPEAPHPPPLQSVRPPNKAHPTPAPH